MLGFGWYPQATGKGLGTLTGGGQPPLPVASPWLRGGHSLPGVAGGSAPRTCCWTVIKPGQPGWATPPGTGWFCKRPKPEGRAPEGLLWGPLSPDPLGTQSAQCTSRPPLGHPPCTHAEPAPKEPPQCICLGAAGVSTRPSAGAPSQHGRWACLPVAGHVVLEPRSPSPWRWGGRGRPACEFSDPSPRGYSRTTVPPTASRAALIFSASALTTLALIS